MDLINIFPKTLQAHKDGTKCISLSEFDNSIWATGGYDSVIRIYDLNHDSTSTNPACLGQYVGHKSIITDVHFVKNDVQIGFKNGRLKLGRM